MANNIIFRKKFEKLLTEENRPAIIGLFDKFCSLKPDEAIEELWDLSLSVGSGEYMKDLKEFGVAQEDILLVRNESRYQYELRNPGFCEIHHPAAQDEINGLVNHAGPIEAFVVFEKCISKLHGSDVATLERTLFLLESEKENLYYGGIRDLGFGKEEADFLKPHHQQIAELFKVLTEEKRQKVSKNTPLAGLAAKLDEAGIKLPKEAMVQKLPGEEADEELPFTFGPEETAVEVVQESQPEEKVVHETQAKASNLTAEAILTYKVAFACFVGGNMNALATLSNLGFDLNEVMAMKEEIKALLEAANALISLGFNFEKFMAMKEEIFALFKAASAFSK